MVNDKGLPEDEFIAQLVESAPPVGSEVRARLADLFPPADPREAVTAPGNASERAA